MKRWQDLAAPDDPESWHDVGRMWPTKRGTYETADFSTATSKTATGADSVSYAVVVRMVDGTTREFVLAGNIWEYSSGSLTDRTGGVSLGLRPHLAQYGDVSILFMGNSTATVKSTAAGGSFSALAGAPQAEIGIVVSNAVLAFNTSTSADGWAASDVGDYTNWSTGESASGRLIQTPGPILAAVAHGNAAYAFKQNAIYRLTYVGGTVKWNVELVYVGIGANNYNGANFAKYQVISTPYGIAFNGNGAGNSVYLFDGVSKPELLNPLTTLGAVPCGFVYNPVEDILTLAPMSGSDENGQVNATASLYFYYSFASSSWGSGIGSAEEDYEEAAPPYPLVNGVLYGDYYARAETSSKPVFYRYRATAGNAIYRCAPSAPGSSATCYLQTKKIGNPMGMTCFDRLVPLLRRRTDLGTDSASLSFELFKEREDTSATATRTVTEATRKRFDLKGGAAEDTYGRFKVTWTALDVEVDDFAVRSRYRDGGE